MIVRNLYLVSGIKYYPAYQGDSGEEHVNLLVPAQSDDDAKKKAEETNFIDEISDASLLYTVIEGCGMSDLGVWEAVEGFDTDLIYRI